MMKAVFACGRMNPPTTGHAKLIATVCDRAAALGAKPYVFVTASHDQSRNPLSPETKLQFLERIFPGVPVAVVKDVYAAARAVAADGCDDAVLVVGEDRREAFAKVADYCGTEALGLEHLAIEVINRPDGDASATAARETALRGDFEGFRRLVPTNDNDMALALYEAVRQEMRVT